MPIWLIDFVAFLLAWLPAILIALPVAIWAFLELKTDRAWRIVFLAAGGTALLYALVHLLALIPISPQYIWSGARLAPAIAWMKGYELFYPVDQGPVLVQMYGPVSALLYAPTALLSRPTTAILVGTFLNFFIYFLPAIVFIRAASRGCPPAVVFAGVAAFVLISSRQFVLAATATLVTIDAPALGLAAAAMMVMIRGDLEHPWRMGLLCGGLAALSAWTKLTFAPVGVAMGVYAFMVAAPRVAWRIVSAMALAGGVVTAMFILWFGPELVVQNLIVPSRQPWTWPQLSPVRALLRAVYYMWKDAWPLDWLMMGTIVLGLVRWRMTPMNFRTWSRESTWLLPLMAALAVFPTALLARVKVGGIWNNVAASGYLALLAAVLFLVHLASGSAAPTIARPQRLGRVLILALLGFGWWIDAATIQSLRSGLAQWAHLEENDHERFYQLARDYPGRIYVPNFPLPSLMAEGLLYHFSAGVDSLAWAGYPMSESHFRKWLPEHMDAVLVFRYTTPPYLMERLSEFDEDAPVPGIPLWKARTRDGRFPSKTPQTAHPPPEPTVSD